MLIYFITTEEGKGWRKFQSIDELKNWVIESPVVKVRRRSIVVDRYAPQHKLLTTAQKNQWLQQQS